MKVFDYLKEDPENCKKLASYIQDRMPELLDVGGNTRDSSKLVIVLNDDYYKLSCCSNKDPFWLTASYNITFFDKDSDFVEIKWNYFFDDFDENTDIKFKNIINQYYRKLKIKEINGNSI